MTLFDFADSDPFLASLKGWFFVQPFNYRIKMIAHYKRRLKDFEYLSLKYNLQELTHDLASYNLVPPKNLKRPQKTFK